VEPDSEIGQWFEWAERFIEVTDIKARFSELDEMLTLYYSGYSSDLARIRREGFKDPEPESDRNQRRLAGITLREQKPEGGWGSDTLEILLPEVAVLPYEVTEPGYVPRVFRLPARVLNRVLAQRGSILRNLGTSDSDPDDVVDE
jgi:hypothetical protein